MCHDVPRHQLIQDLRRSANLPDEAGPELDALIEECDTLRFAPGASGEDGRDAGAAVPPALAERARGLIEDRMRGVDESGDAS